MDVGDESSEVRFVPKDSGAGSRMLSRVLLVVQIYVPLCYRVVLRAVDTIFNALTECSRLHPDPDMECKSPMSLTLNVACKDGWYYYYLVGTGGNHKCLCDVEFAAEDEDAFVGTGVGHTEAGEDEGTRPIEASEEQRRVCACVRVCRRVVGRARRVRAFALAYELCVFLMSLRIVSLIGAPLLSIRTLKDMLAHLDSILHVPDHLAAAAEDGQFNDAEEDGQFNDADEDADMEADQML